ncbi:MAG TPA: methyltransferase domain-containing protein [Mariprofundaceae bacterium]|nr:methyltransferase domain-containing protein [Mariprofundaceae bacterium]
MNTELNQRLDDFLASLPMHAIAGEVSGRIGRSAPDIEAMLGMYANEARASLALVAGHLEPGARILEAGAGLCIFSIFLKSQGYDITALEPATGGFDLFSTLKQAVLAHTGATDLPVLDIPAQALDPASHGRFDLIFSNNVIEHIPGWKEALDAMLGVLSQGGRMLHSCPNYAVPYEPHFGIPVFRRLPGLSRALFGKRIASHPELWQSLNFLTYGQVMAFCLQRGLPVEFERGLLQKALARLDSDPSFRARHSSPLLLGSFALLKTTGLLKLLGSLPPGLTTPMIFTISRSAEASPAKGE